MIKYNIYKKPLNLNSNELLVYNTIISVGKNKKYFHNDRKAFPKKKDYIATSHLSSPRPIFELTGLSAREYTLAIYHLLINGIVEKIFLEDDKFYYRIPM